MWVGRLEGAVRHVGDYSTKYVLSYVLQAVLGRPANGKPELAVRTRRHVLSARSTISRNGPRAAGRELRPVSYP